METRPGQAEVRGARQIPEGERLRGAGGRRKRDRCREEEIKTEGTESRREGVTGRRKATETTGTGRRAERGGRRAAERWKQRAEGPQGTESRGPPRGLAQEGSKQGEAINQRDPKPPHSAVGIQVYTGSLCCPGTAPGPHSHATTCQPHAAWLCSHATLVLGLTLRDTDTGPVSPWHLVSLPPAHTPQSSLPASQQSQELNNGAVWLRALILHRARPEAPTRHSCPQWRLPAKGPTSCPATHLPGAEAQGPTPPWLAQAETPRKAWTETRGGIGIPHLCLAPLPEHERVSSCAHAHSPGRTLGTLPRD